jgi:hypothetical protein
MLLPAGQGEGQRFQTMSEQSQADQLGVVILRGQQRLRQGQKPGQDIWWVQELVKGYASKPQWQFLRC